MYRKTDRRRAVVDYEKLEQAMVDLDEQAVLDLMGAVAAGEGDAALALEACTKGLDSVGRLYEEGSYFIPDLIFAGEVMTKAAEIVKPLLSGGGDKNLGAMIFATVKDDLHDIGKNIVKAMMDAAGFEVIDLGVDVAPEAIVAAAKEHGAKVIGLSGLLSLAIGSMKDTVDCFVAAGIRDDVKIIIGGNPVSEDTCQLVGADGWARSPHKGVQICKAWATGA
jgi:methylmalonyl-CoA mutase cobalamin-binding domain/chain